MEQKCTRRLQECKSAKWQSSALRRVHTLQSHAACHQHPWPLAVFVSSSYLMRCLVGSICRAVLLMFESVCRVVRLERPWLSRLIATHCRCFQQLRLVPPASCRRRRPCLRPCWGAPCSAPLRTSWPRPSSSWTQSPAWSVQAQVAASSPANGRVLCLLLRLSLPYSRVASAISLALAGYEVG